MERRRHDARRTANPTDLALWWQRFDDPALPALVTQALQANTDVKSAQAALLQARAQTDVQRAGLGPTLGASASAQRSQTGGASPTNRFQAGFDASWEPDIFGGNRSALEASDADAQAAAASLANVQVSLAAEVAVNTDQPARRCRPGWRSRAATWPPRPRPCRSRAGVRRRVWCRRSTWSRP